MNRKGRKEREERSFDLSRDRLYDLGLGVDPEVFRIVAERLSRKPRAARLIAIHLNRKGRKEREERSFDLCRDRLCDLGALRGLRSVN